MRKWITFLMTVLVGSAVSYVNADAGQVTFEAGYRRDNISWNHRLHDSQPILKTSSRFKDLDIFQIGVKGRTTLGYNLYIRGNAYWGWILDGDFKESVTTYNSTSFSDTSFRTGTEFSENNHNVIDDKYVYGIGAAIGYPFYLCDCTMYVAPVIGYAFDEQNVRLDDESFDLSQTSGGLVYPVTGQGCCRHKYITRWYGPFVGVDFNYRPADQCWNIYSEFEYHFGEFSGRRHNNFFNIGDSSDHRSRDADAFVFCAGADYDLSNCWTVGFSVKFQDWYARKHHRHNSTDSIFNVVADSGSTSTTGDYFGSSSSSSGSGSSGRSRDTHRWHSYAINLTIGRLF